MEATENRLHSLLFAEGRELVNIKFFPGSDRGLTAGRMQDAAATAISAALASDMTNLPPIVGGAAVTLEDFVNNR